MTIDLVPMYPLTYSDADVDAARRSRRLSQPLVPRPGARPRIPGGHARAVREHPPGDRGRRPRDDRGAARLPRRQLLHAARRVCRGGGCNDRRWSRPPAPSTRTWGGRSIRTGCTDLLARLHDEYELPAALHHRERRRLRGRSAERAASTTRSGRRTSSATSTALGARDRRRRAGRAATSSGRCSTTSSGRWATRSGSASSTSTSRRSSACRRRATRGTATSSPPRGQRASSASA